jgi:hypothetical protein
VIIATTLLIALFQGSAEPQLDTESVVLSEQDQNIMRRFDGLPEDEQTRIATELQQQVLDLENPLCEAARLLLNDRKLRNAKKNDKGDLPAYSAAEFAPQLKLRTRTVKPGSRHWKSFVKSNFRQGLPDRSKLWDWDYGPNSLLQAPTRPPRDVVIDLLIGRWPLNGKLSAYAEGALDRDKDFDAAADYFAHAYRDRDGKVYQGISLFDIWSAQTTFGISDVESIAFMRKIAKNDRYVSPIPASKHNRIYKQIEAQFESYREYRSLRFAIAQRFVDPNGTLPVQFRGITATFDKAWVLMEHKPRRMAAFLERHTTRSEFLAAIAKDMPEPGKESEIAHWEAHWEARTTLSGLIRSTALDFLADEGLLGFRRR